MEKLAPTMATQNTISNRNIGACDILPADGVGANAGGGRTQTS